MHENISNITRDSPAPQVPFVYIAAIRRTGSKVLARALSSLPHGFIFRETGLGRGNFSVGNRDIAAFGAAGVDLPPIIDHLQRVPRRFRIRTFAVLVLPYLRTVARQVGIKEIRNRHWRSIAETFSDVRIVVTARDPRDIFLSLAHKERDRGVAFADRVTPERLAAHVQEQFNEQRAMLAEHGGLAVRYEDFCTNPNVLRAIRRSVGSTVTGMGDVARDQKPERAARVPDVHGGEITTQRTARWKSETDAELRAAAERTYDLLPEYIEFWAYGCDGPDDDARIQSACMISE